MSIQQIDQLFWYQKRNCMVVTYRDGEADRIAATETAAAALAEDARLVLVPTRPGVVRWVRNPESSCPSWSVCLTGPRHRASNAAH
jgi:hypothetical protein